VVATIAVGAALSFEASGGEAGSGCVSLAVSAAVGAAGAASMSVLLRTPSSVDAGKVRVTIALGMACKAASSAADSLAAGMLTVAVSSGTWHCLVGAAPSTLVRDTGVGVKGTGFTPTMRDVAGATFSSSAVYSACLGGHASGATFGLAAVSSSNANSACAVTGEM